MIRIKNVSNGSQTGFKTEREIIVPDRDENKATASRYRDQFTAIAELREHKLGIQTQKRRLQKETAFCVFMNR